MALETATYISDLVSTNPTASDNISQGDDHIRLLKSSIKATFPNITGAVTPTHTKINDLATVTGTETLTNKTLTNPAINGFTGDTSVVNLGSGQFYKTTGGNVGIGTTSPANKLHIYDATTAQANLFGDATTVFAMARASTDANGSALQLRKARGTQASSTAVASNDTLGNVNFQAYGGTNYRNVASIGSYVDTYTSDTNISGGIQFSTNSGGTGTTERMRIDPVGNVILTGTGATTMQSGTTAQRPTAVTGMFRYNTTLTAFEGYNGTQWGSLGGAQSDVFYENAKTVSANYTITSNKNAMSTGPITINSGVTVTVPSGSRWVVL